MKIKDIIEHLKTLDQDKELIVLGTDPTDWTYSQMVTPETINIESVYPYDENGLEGMLEMGVDEDGHENEEVECYVIRISC